MGVRIFAGIVLLSGIVCAQSDRGRMLGRVLDASGSTVPNATVENRSTNLRRQTVTNTGSSQFNEIRFAGRANQQNTLRY